MNGAGRKREGEGYCCYREGAIEKELWSRIRRRSHMDIDQSIVLLQRERREMELEEIKQREKAQYDLKQIITYELEELIAGIKSGKQFLYTLKMNFEPKQVLNDQWSIPFILDFFDIMEDEPSHLLLTSNRRNVSMVMGATSCVQLKPMKEWISETKSAFKQLNLRMKLVHSQSVNHMEYFCYEIPTGEGVTYNISFRFNKNKQIYSGTLNCMNEEKKGMGLMLEALIHVMEEMNQ